MSLTGAFGALREVDARALRDALAAHGRVRVPGFAAPDAASVERISRDVRWRRLADAERALEQAPLDPCLAAPLQAALAPLAPALRHVRLVRHGAGAFGLPPMDGLAFTLDLTLGWTSDDGGLLLFVDADGRVEGWRPEAGALTLYDSARPPVLSMLPPTVRRARLAIFGGL